MLGGSRLLTILWCGALAAATAVAALGWIPVGAWALGGFELVAGMVPGFGLLGLLALAGVAGVAGAAVLLRAAVASDRPHEDSWSDEPAHAPTMRERMRPALRDCAWLAPAPLLMVGSFALLRVVPTGLWAMRDREFAALAERSAELTDALARYLEREGHAPLSLDALVPDDLAKRPRTGLHAFPRYRYELFAGGLPGARLAWYDLGANPPATYLFEDRRFGRLEPDGHALLVVVLGPDGRVLGADTDSMPSHVAAKSFDAERWSRREQRRTMARDAIERVRGLDERAVRDLLGPPDGEGPPREHEHDAPYELSVACPSGLINWDVFVYWPGADYPEHMYGGWVERIGDWAYVHE